MEKPWHSLDVDNVLSRLGTNRSGLTLREAGERLAKYGLNELKGKKETPPLLIFLSQFVSPLIYILMAAAVFSFVIGHYLDAAVITAVLILNAFIGFIQEIRAEKAMKALMELAAPRAKVIRDNGLMSLPARGIVPGDIVLLETGDKVPADLRLIEASNLKVDESALTGESVPVGKVTGITYDGATVAERANLAHTGTIVTYGRGTGVTIATGMATELGKIAESIEGLEEGPTPLQKSIARFGRFTILLFSGILAVLVVIGLFKGLDPVDMFLLGVAAAVSAIPEGLPAAVTVILAIGMRLMAERHAIIRRLVAVETLGSTTVICTDKTGTLTLNQMTAREIYIDGDFIKVTGEGYRPAGDFQLSGKIVRAENQSSLKLVLEIGALCSDASLSVNGDKISISGDPTEAALVVAAHKAGLIKAALEKAFPRLDEVPFQSEKQLMATLNRMERGNRISVKGSAEKILSVSKYIFKEGKILNLEESGVQAVHQATTRLASGGLRVIAAAYADVPAGKNTLQEGDVRDLVFVGLVGMADPPRREARLSIKHCKEAGIKVVMITGDHKLTAESIARELEIPPGKTVTGLELKEMNDDVLSREIEDITVFARIEPLQKLRIVNAFKANGEVVAMTGDGVNDAPALRAADIGIAMGISGTDVAKEAGDMVLADDNFASIVSAVQEGRAIFERLRSVIFYLISTNLSELVTLILSVLLLGQTPLLPVQIIWVNLVTDTAGAIPLGFEPGSGMELREKPRHPGVGLIFPGLAFRIIVFSLLIGAGTFFLFQRELKTVSLREARTAAFCTMVTYQWFAAFYARSDEIPIFRKGLLRNRYLLGFIFIAILLQMAVCYIPFLQSAFNTVPLSPGQWVIIIAVAGSLFILEEIRKVFFPRLFSYGKWQPGRNNNPGYRNKH